MNSDNDTPSSNLVRASEHFSDFPETFPSLGSQSNTNETSDVSEPLHPSLTQLGTDVTSSDSGLYLASGEAVDGVRSSDIIDRPSSSSSNLPPNVEIHRMESLLQPGFIQPAQAEIPQDVNLGSSMRSSDSGLSFPSGYVVEDGVLSCDRESLAERNSSRTESCELDIMPLQALIARGFFANSPITGDGSESNQEHNKSDQPTYR